MDENLSQTSSSSDGNSEECSCGEEISAESSNSAENCSCDDEYSTDESAIIHRHLLHRRQTEDSGGLSSVKRESPEDSSSSSKEESSSSEDKSFEDERYMKEFGLVFLKPIMKENSDIKIVTVGHKDCGKTQLIKSVFADHPSFNSWNRRNRDEYHIRLNNRAHFQILIYDVMDVEYVKEADFPSKTVFFFCYDMGDLYTLKDLQDTWIPLFFNNFDEKMLHLLVGMEREPPTEEMAAERVKNQEEFKAAKEKLLGLFCRHLSSCVSCSFEDKGTMLDVFQSAIDAAYPWVSMG